MFSKDSSKLGLPSTSPEYLRSYQISKCGRLRLELTPCRLLLFTRQFFLRSDFLRHLVAILPQFFFFVFQPLSAFFFQKPVAVGASFSQRVVVFLQLLLAFRGHCLGFLEMAGDLFFAFSKDLIDGLQ